MAVNFVVETGSGSATATAYLTIAQLKQYWDNYGYSYSNVPDGTFQQKINKATEILDSQYTTLWPGKRKSETQALDWPREDATYIDGTEIAETVVPPEVKKAVSEYVYADVSGTNLQPVHDTKGTVMSESVRVDVVEQTTRYSEYSALDSTRSAITAVDDALARLVHSTLGNFSNLTIARV